MSSLAGRIGPSGRLRRRATTLALPRFVDADLGLTLGVAAALSTLAFYARGGVALEQNTWAQVVLVLVGAGLGALAIAAPSRHAPVARFHGALTLAALAALVVWTAVSVNWSLAPSESWLETNRALSYLGAFVAGLALVRLAPGRWAALLHGLWLACLIVSAWALATKVFPGALAETELFARLRAPFGYWNSVGLMAASGVVPLLWLGARRSGHAALNALAYPALGLLFVCLMLSYSRGAILALLAGLVLWFAIVPLRLRSAVTFLIPAAAAGAVTAWAFSQEGLTQDRLPLPERADAGTELGLLLVLMGFVLLAAGLAIGFTAAKRSPSPRVRTAAGRAVMASLALVAVAGVVGLATAPGGIGGQVSKAWTQLTDPEARTPANTPGRLTAASSVRARYWREALDIHAEAKLVGAGAGAYGTARKRYRTGNLEVQHAHGFLIQTLSDLGWIGLLISLLAAAAWIAAAARAIGRRTIWDAERVGLVALACVAIVFTVHSLIDWTWFIPANAVLGLLAAGWIAGRGPRRSELPEGEVTVPLASAAAPRRWSAAERLRAWRPEPGRTALATGVLITAVAISWTIVQPLRAVHASDAALERLSMNAFDAAADIAKIASERNPLSVEPLWELAAIEQARGRTDAAHDALADAVALQPANAEAWRRLGRFRLLAMSRPQEALDPLRAAYYLDPQNPESTSDFLEVQRAVAES